MQPHDLWVVLTTRARHASPKARAFIAFVEEPLAVTIYSIC